MPRSLPSIPFSPFLPPSVPFPSLPPFPSLGHPSAQPDPTGFHLNVVADVARLYLGRGGHPQLYPRERSPLAAAFDRAGLGVENADFAAFWDWGSLHQKGEGDAPRSAEEAALYAAGRQASTVWYAHEQTVSWLQTAVPVNYRTLPDLLDAYRHGASGWTHLERVLSASIKADPQRVLDIGRTVAQSCGRAGSHVAQAERAAQAALQNAYGGRGPLVEANCLEKSCAAAERYPLMTPKELRALLLSEAKRFRPSGPFAASCEGWQSEAEVVSELYETFFDTVAQTEGRLCRRRVGWGDAEAMPLAHSLPSFTALREIDLRGNDAIGTEAWRAIGHAILLLAEHPPPYDGLESVMLDGVSSSLPIRLLRGKTPSSQPPPGGGEDTQGDGHDRGGGGGGGVGGASFASVGGALLTCASPSRSSGAGGQPKGTSALAELLHRKTQIRALERVDLDRRALGSPSAFAIGALLSGAYPNIPPNSAITELDCRHNPLITGEGARTLAEAVVSLPQIRTFSLIPISRLRDEPKSRDRGPDGPDKFKPLHELDLFDHGLGAAAPPLQELLHEPPPLWSLVPTSPALPLYAQSPLHSSHHPPPPLVCYRRGGGARARRAARRERRSPHLAPSRVQPPRPRRRHRHCQRAASQRLSDEAQSREQRARRGRRRRDRGRAARQQRAAHA